MDRGDAADGSGVLGTVTGAIRERFVVKFFLSVLVVMLITAGIGAVFHGSATATLTDRTESKMESTAQLQAQGIERWVDGLRHQTRELSETPAFQAGGASRVDFYLSTKKSEFRQEILDVHYLALDNGTVMASTSSGVEGTDLRETDVPWAAESYDEVAATVSDPSNVYVASRTYESPASGDRVVAFASSPPGNEDHALVVEANLSVCDGSFHQPTEEGYTTVHGGDGQPICGGAAEGPSDVPDGVLAASGAGFTAAGDQVLGHATVETADWTVAAHAPRDAAFAVREQIGTTIAAMVAVPLLALGAVGVLVGLRADRELDALTTKAERMREGDLDVDLATDRADEFGDLYRGFDEMRDALKQQIEEAEAARREAEASRAEAVETNRHLRERAADYSDVMAACARGDLTRRMERDDEHEAMDRIATDFNEMIRELELTTGQLQTFAEEVRDGGEDLHASAEAIRDASEQVAESIQKISDDAYAQRDRLGALAEEVDAVADQLQALDGERADLDLRETIERVERAAAAVDAAAEAGQTITAESETVAGAAEEQAAELGEVSARALELKRTAQYLGDGIDHFETEAEHEFVFQTGADDEVEE